MGQFTNMSDGSWVTKFDPCQVVSHGSMMYRRCRNFVRIKGLIRWLTGEVTWRSMDWCSPYGEHGACQYCRSAAEMDRRSSHLHRNIRSIEYLISSNNRFWIFVGTDSIFQRLIFRLSARYDVTPLLQNLHWLPIQKRVVISCVCWCLTLYEALYLHT